MTLSGSLVLRTISWEMAARRAIMFAANWKFISSGILSWEATLKVRPRSCRASWSFKGFDSAMTTARAPVKGPET